MIDRREFALMLRFSSESFSPEEIEVRRTDMTGSRDNGKKYPEKREILFQAVMEEADGDGNGKMFS